MSDHLVALRLQSTLSQQNYEDAELACAEEERLRSLVVKSEFNQRYAQSLDQRGGEGQGLITIKLLPSLAFLSKLVSAIK